VFILGERFAFLPAMLKFGSKKSRILRCNVSLMSYRLRGAEEVTPCDRVFETLKNGSDVHGCSGFHLL
jgi:hypothetical protein